MATDTLHIPVTATYRIIDGEAVKIAAEYADVPTDIIARLLVRGFGLPTPENSLTTRAT